LNTRSTPLSLDSHTIYLAAGRRSRCRRHTSKHPRSPSAK